jgi:hypothetical protein
LLVRLSGRSFLEDPETAKKLARVIFLLRFLLCWRRTLPHKVPRESLRKRSGDDVRGLVSELGIQFGGLNDGQGDSAQGRSRSTAGNHNVRYPANFLDAVFWPVTQNRFHN